MITQVVYLFILETWIESSILFYKLLTKNYASISQRFSEQHFLGDFFSFNWLGLVRFYAILTIVGYLIHIKYIDV